jgi:hypothetical protein
MISSQYSIKIQMIAFAPTNEAIFTNLGVVIYSRAPNTTIVGLIEGQR